MAKYKCSKCGATATSKCTVHHDVFYTGSLLPTFMQYSITPVAIRNNNEVSVELKIRRWKGFTDTDNSLLLGVINMIRELSDEDVKAYACGNHDWVLQDDTCELGCCHKPTPFTGTRYSADKPDPYTEINPRTGQLFGEIPASPQDK